MPQTPESRPYADRIMETHHMNINEIHLRTTLLRSNRRFKEAYQWVAEQATRQKHLQGLVWEHQPIFWGDIQAGICKLTRRNGSDAAFVEALWRNDDFVYSFHRHAATFLKGRRDLAKILEQEFLATIGLSKSLHWIVRDIDSNPWGILSLVDISLIHQRAEVMLGVLPGAPFGLSTAAMLTLFQFYFRALKFKKLYSFVYDDNPHSLKGTLHLGFKIEGRLRKHVLDPRSGNYLDLIQTGLLAEDAFTPDTAKLMRRLLTS